MKKFLLALSLLLLPTVAFGADKDHPWGDAANKVTDFAISRMNSLIDATSKALPTVTKYAMEVVSLDCMMGLIHLFWTLPLCIIGWCYMIKLWKWCIKNLDDSGGATALIILIYTLGILALTIINLVTISNGWRWVCIFRPDLYLIHLAIQKVLEG